MRSSSRQGIRFIPIGILSKKRSIPRIIIFTENAGLEVCIKNLVRGGSLPSRKNIVLLFFAIFLFRLLFGLCQSNWSDYDEKQSYLTGLKFYTTGFWPYFGPDAAGSESSYYSQIPGALEGLVIGLPFYILPIPEAPYILVNLLSAAGVLFLAWYIYKRIPQLSFIWLSLWIATTPWSIYYPTHISNMSYLYFSGILFAV